LAEEWGVVGLAAKSRFRRLSQFAFVASWALATTPLFAQLPYINAGPDSAFAQVDFAQMYLDNLNRRLRLTEKQKAQDKELVESGAVSALDLEAPNGAIEQFNRACSLLKDQNSAEAIKHLQKAIRDYPKFVSAHVVLGRAYVDQEDTVRAKTEFQAAADLDNKFALPLLNLGRIALAQNDFSAAQSELEQAATLRPKDVTILSTLAYAQNGNHQYLQTLATVQRIHALNHERMANVHYVAASAAQSLKDYAAMERELTTFLLEAPTSEYAAIARKNLAALEYNKTVGASATAQPASALLASNTTVTFPNTDRLKAQLNALGNESDCIDCATSAAPESNVEAVNNSSASSAPSALERGASGMWTIRKSVDDVVVFFSVSNHGHMINDLQQSDIEIRDDNKPPVRILQFLPQSKLPLRLALLIDTSGSVSDRFSFEKNAAAKFVDKVLNHSSDLAFVEGFSTQPTITQDFSADPKELEEGIQNLANGGGTSLFDAVSFACRKLADYPETEHVARVLVILSDGEDNSSHNSLKQSIQVAENSGVTIYAVSTKEGNSDKTDADKVLESLAERSGGEAMFPGDVFTLGRSFDKLRDVIRSRYFVAYKPAAFEPDGTYRTISITAEKNGKHFEVRARKGYHARQEAPQ
jgi:Ca-activated chloride channel homolog